MFIDRGKRKAPARITAATSNATPIPITPGPTAGSSRGIGPALPGQQRRKDPGHEEDERVQQGEGAEPLGGAGADRRETQRASAGGRIACLGVHEGDLMVYPGHHLR